MSAAEDEAPGVVEGVKPCRPPVPGERAGGQPTEQCKEGNERAPTGAGGDGAQLGCVGQVGTAEERGAETRCDEERDYVGKPEQRNESGNRKRPREWGREQLAGHAIDGVGDDCGCGGQQTGEEGGIGKLGVAEGEATDGHDEGRGQREPEPGRNTPGPAPSAMTTLELPGPGRNCESATRSA